MIFAEMVVDNGFGKVIGESRGDYIEPDYPCAWEDAIKMLYNIVSDN